MPNKKQTKKEIKKEIKESRLKSSAKKFNKELKNTLNTALIAAFGFLIALTWRDLITNYVNSLTSISPIQGDLMTATIITIIGVVGIVIVTSFLHKEE